MPAGGTTTPERWISIVLTLVISFAGTLGLQTSAHATLNSAWTISDSEAGAINTRYDWSFNANRTGSDYTALQLKVPPGTSGTGERYLTTGGTIGNFARTTTAVPTVTGDVDIRVEAQLDSWANGTNSQRLLTKTDAPGQAYAIQVTATGVLQFIYFPVGGSQTNVGTTALGFAPKSRHWVRATFRPDNNSGGRTAVLYRSENGTDWTEISSHNAPGVVTLDPDPSVISVAGANTSFLVKGRTYYADVTAGINGTTYSPTSCVRSGVTQCFDPDYAPPLKTTGIDAGSTDDFGSYTGEVWRVSPTSDGESATLLDRVDLASELVVANISGIPSGGLAEIRDTTESVWYQFPTGSSPATVNNGAPIQFGVTGLTNTATTGSFRTTIILRANQVWADGSELDYSIPLTKTFTAKQETLNSGSVKLSNPVPSAVANYEFTANGANASTPVNCVQLRGSKTSNPFFGRPEGMTLTSATLIGTNWNSGPNPWTAKGYHYGSIVDVQTYAGSAPTAGSLTFVIGNIVNPNTNGTFFVTVSSFKRSNCTEQVDSLTVAFVTNGGTVVSAEVKPNVTFTVAARNEACNGLMPTAGSVSTPSAVSLGRMNSAAAAVAAQDLIVTANSGQGITVYARSTGPLSGASGVLDDLMGSNESPISFPDTGNAFGYTTSDRTLEISGPNAFRFTGTVETPAAKWAPFSTANKPVLFAPGVTVNETECIAFQVMTAADLPADRYSTTITYSAVPLF